MIRNKRISSNINQWQVEFDPYGFTENEDWLVNAEKTEDILQLSHIYGDGPLLDVRYYNGVYKAMVILNSDWDSPLENEDSQETNIIVNAIYRWIDKYANGVPVK